jgi:signal peptidase I
LGGAVTLLCGYALILSPTAPILWAIAVLAVGLPIVVLAAVDAHRTVVRGNDPDFERNRKSTKDGWLAALLTMLLPGTGHLYLKRWLWGIAFLAAVLLLAALIPSRAWRLAAGEALILAAGISVLRLAPRRAPNDLRRFAWFFAAHGALFGLLWVVFLSTYAGVFAVAGDAMVPAIEPGDRVLVRRLHGRLPRRGDIVLLDVNESGRITSVLRRVAATGGETVTATAKGLCVDGRPLPTTRFLLGDVERSFLTMARGIEYPCHVPDGQVFVLSDDLSSAYDSRYFGAVHLENVKGVAVKIMWPPRRSGPL